jgi:ubiquinone/menaquinone biosynthesis C-methylase UbiE
MKDLERDSREKYNNGSAYNEATITHSLLKTEEPGYSQRLLSIKAELLKSLVGSKRVLDIGCADGRHLAELSPLFASGTGVDFSDRFINSAKRNYGHIENIKFMSGDARHLEIPDQSVDVVFSFATLYYVNDIREVYSEVARVLAPNGIAVLEVGNSRSLATKISRRPENAELAQHSSRTIDEHLQALKAANLKVLQHRSFQILPMWGNLDGLLSLLRRPALDRLMSRTVGSRMVDERVSSLPLVKKLAFRHLIVCQKP